MELRRLSSFRAGRAVVLFCIAAVLVSACYDSRWGEAKRAQQRAAKQIAPAQLQASGADESSPMRLAKAVHLRVDVSPDYQGQVVDWAADFDRTTERANEVLSRDLGIRLIVDERGEWSPRARTDDLHVALDALESDEPNRGDEIVVGLLGSLPRASDDFHDVGMARVLGHHLLLRAATRAGEHDTIERSFDELPEDQRRHLRAELVAHRATAVLLHELGHVLGALHEQSSEGLMYPRYDRKMSGFAPENVALMQMTLAHKGDATKDAFYKERLAYLEGAPEGVWIESERVAAESALHAVLDHATVRDAGAVAVAVAPVDAGAPEDPPPQDLTEADRATFLRARAQLKAGDAASASRTAAPLYKKYPQSYGVADLRCKIASASGFGWERVRAECDPLMRLSGVPSSK